MIDLSKICAYVPEVKFELSTVAHSHEIPLVTAVARMHEYEFSTDYPARRYVLYDDVVALVERNKQ